jgi:pimeloyl-ACP methyl ester carboxylesterase
MAAAEPLGDRFLLHRAAGTLGIDLKAAGPAQDGGLLELGRHMPVFVANSDSDDPAPLLLPARRPDPPRRSQDPPDSAHGFLFQHHAEFATDVDAFLTRG